MFGQETGLPRLLSRPSEFKLQLTRNVAVGAAGVAFVIVLALLDSGARTLPRVVALYAATIAMPFWLLAALVHEIYILLGRRSYMHLRTSAAIGLHKLVQLAGGGSPVVSVGALVYSIAPEAVYVFAPGSARAFGILLLFDQHLERWLAEHGREEESARPGTE